MGNSSMLSRLAIIVAFGAVYNTVLESFCFISLHFPKSFNYMHYSLKFQCFKMRWVVVMIEGAVVSHQEISAFLFCSSVVYDSVLFYCCFLSLRSHPFDMVVQLLESLLYAHFANCYDNCSTEQKIEQCCSPCLYLG